MNTIGLKLITEKPNTSETMNKLYLEINSCLPKQKQMINTTGKKTKDFIRFYTFQKQTGISPVVIDFYENIKDNYPVLPKTIYDLYTQNENIKLIEETFSPNNFSEEKLLEILNFKRVLSYRSNCYKEIENKILLDKDYNNEILNLLNLLLEELELLPKTTFFEKLRNRFVYKINQLTTQELFEKFKCKQHNSFYEFIYEIISDKKFEDELDSFGLNNMNYSYSNIREILYLLMLQKPKNFIELIKKRCNDEEGLKSLNMISILFLQQMNLNTINYQQLTYLIEKTDKNNQVTLINWFKENKQTPTIKEFIELYKILSFSYYDKDMSKSKINTYCKLKLTKEDDKLRLIKELNNANFFNFSREEQDVLIEKINKPIYQMMNNNVHQITSPKVFLKYLLIKDYVKNLILTESEILFIYESKIDKPINNIEEVKLDILKSEKIKELQSYIKTSNEFMLKYIDNVINVLSNGYVDIINTYFRQANKTIIKDNFVPIVKAYLMGEDSFKMMKFFKGDLSKEVEYSISDTIESLWETNTSLKDGKFKAYETYSFEDIIRLGETPVSTCMHWNKSNAIAGGRYNHCLLSNFDSNKKLIKVERDGKVIARAILRLTKVSNKQLYKNDFTFIDVENLERFNNKNKDDEKLVLFIERIYCCDDSNLLNVKNIIIKLMKEKATNMEIPLYSSFETSKHIGVKREFMYISKSKNGYQYIDSLRGEQGPNAGGEYIGSTFYIY